MLEVDGPKGNPKEAWKRIRGLIGPFTRRFPEKRAHEVAYGIALDYNIGLETWSSWSAEKHEASAIAKRARSLAEDLGKLSDGLLLKFHRHGKMDPELLRAAGLDISLLSSVGRFLDEKAGITSSVSRLLALAKLNDIFVRSEKRKFRKVPFLKQELAFSCACFLAACGKSYPLKRGGAVAELAAAEFEWATGKQTDADDFDGQIVALQQSKRAMNDFEGASSWDQQVQRLAAGIVRERMACEKVA
jgi:hypothetical protein